MHIVACSDCTGCSEGWGGRGEGGKGSTGLRGILFLQADWGKETSWALEISPKN
jgi:hypothetical protein